MIDKVTDDPAPLRLARRRCAVIPGSIEHLAADDPRRAAFGRLHAMSVAWLGLPMTAAGVSIVLASMASTLRGPDDEQSVRVAASP